MKVSISRQPKMLVALLAAVLALLAVGSMGSASKADAALSPYCGNQTINPWVVCWGAGRKLYAVYGWGDQARVCVWASVSPGGAGPWQTCSSGAGSGTYNSLLAPSEAAWLYPDIQNASGFKNTVHGVAYQP